MTQQRTVGHRANVFPVTVNIATGIIHVHIVGIKSTIIRTLNVVRLVTDFDIQ
jgi:hypothetical protein